MDKLLIVKLGGKVLEQPDLMQEFADFFGAYPHSKIVVHGGGKQATELAGRMGYQAQMIDGRRITDAPMLDIALMTYAGLLNKKLVAQINAKGAQAIGVTGADANLIRAVKRPVDPIDFGYVGDVVSVQAKTFQQLLQMGFSPVVCALTHDGEGQMLNTNADTMATEIAQALHPFYSIELWMCMDLPGVMKDLRRPESVLPQISKEVYDTLVLKGAIDQGMIPKMDTAFQTLATGVTKVFISNIQGLIDPNQPKTQII